MQAISQYTPFAYRGKASRAFSRNPVGDVQTPMGAVRQGELLSGVVPGTSPVIGNARKVIGYAPEDDTEMKYAQDIVTFLMGHR